MIEERRTVAKLLSTWPRIAIPWLAHPPEDVVNSAETSNDRGPFT